MRRGRPGRLPGRAGRVLGGAVADHAAQGRRAPAAGRRLARGRDRRVPPTPCCCATGGGSGRTPTCRAWSRRWRRTGVGPRRPGRRARRRSDRPRPRWRPWSTLTDVGPRLRARPGPARRACRRPPRPPGSTCRSQPWARAADGLGAPLVVGTTPAGATDGLVARVPRRAGAAVRGALRPLADARSRPPGGTPGAGGRRPGPAGAPGRAAGAADDRVDATGDGAAMRAAATACCAAAGDTSPDGARSTAAAQAIGPSGRWVRDGRARTGPGGSGTRWTMSEAYGDQSGGRPQQVEPAGPHPDRAGGPGARDRGRLGGLLRRARDGLGRCRPAWTRTGWPR